MNVIYGIGIIVMGVACLLAGLSIRSAPHPDNFEAAGERRLAVTLIVVCSVILVIVGAVLAGYAFIGQR